jgi:5-methylcytosine-specific restriction protein B
MKTFSIVKRKDEKEYGEFRTKRVILEIYDEMKRAMETGVPNETRLVPSPADAAVRHEGKEKGRCRTIYQRMLRAYFAASKYSTPREFEQWNLFLMSGLTGVWTTGATGNPVEVPVEQAVEIAREHRNQLLEGCKLIENMPLNGTDADYKNLQQIINKLAPNVSQSTWGHKYFSVLYPDIIDPIHIFSLQRFYSIKLLQKPPQDEGRFLATSRFLTIAQELDIPLNHIMHVMYARNGFIRYYWRIGTSDGTTPRNLWELMREGNCVAIGWPKLGDLSRVINNKDGRDIIKRAMEVHYPNIPPVLGKLTRQIFMFVSGIYDVGMYGPGNYNGDLVLASDGANVLGIGELIGNYTFEPSSDCPHRRPIKWLSLEEWRQPDVEGLNTTVHNMRKDTNLIEAERHILDARSMTISPAASSISPITPIITVTTHVTSALPRLTGIPARIQAVLERKGQVILYGPPGTGKTYWSEVTAHELAARTSFSTTFDQLSPEQRTALLGDNRASRGKVRLCSFHPAYGYEDFLEGFRPEPINGQMQFVPRAGIFKQLCQDALASPGEKFYLVIDEINRGDIPRIFGELLTVLEKDKRGKSILLPLTNTPFMVPENVYIIGTMNTADRSIALLDTALRRRFGFVELMPDLEPLKNTAVGGIPLGLWFEALNQRLREHVGRDARNLQIGHAYFLEKGQPITDLATFVQVIQDDILPLLEEYCYEDYAKLEKILGPGLVDTRNQRIRHELFAPSQQAELIQALLAPSHDISTSALAAAIEAQASEVQLEEGGDDESENQEA